jgi:hypothetical protein
VPTPQPTPSPTPVPTPVPTPLPTPFPTPVSLTAHSVLWNHTSILLSEDEPSY